jgi:hypothetical protein
MAVRRAVAAAASAAPAPPQALRQYAASAQQQQLWLPPAAFAAQLEPYRRLTGVLIREDCASIAVSNPYYSLAEKVGGVMLRDGGRVPVRALQLLVRKAVEVDQIAGFVIGESDAADEDGTKPFVTLTVGPSPPPLHPPLHLPRKHKRSSVRARHGGPVPPDG